MADSQQSTAVVGSRPSLPKVWFLAARPRTLPAAVAPVICGSALAWHDHRFVWIAATACLLFSLLIQIGTNFANDYFDYLKGADTAARVGPRRAVAMGWVSPKTMKVAMCIVFALAFAVGLTLLRFGGWPLLVIGVASIICGIAYTGGPWPLAYNGMGDLFVFIFFGLVAVGATYFVQTGVVTLEAIMIGAGVGMLAVNILVVNNYRDVETDTLANKRTLAVRFGRGFARGQFIAGLLVAFAVPVVLWTRGFSLWVLVPLILIPIGWKHTQRLRHATTPQQLIALLGDTGKLLAIYSLLFAIGLGMGK